SMVLSFGLRDSESNVVAMMKFLINVKNPNDIFEETSKKKVLFKRYKFIDEKYQKIMRKAEENIEGDILFFTYSGDMSISQYVANELSYKYPHKAIVVVYTKGNVSNISLRWEKDIRLATVNAIKDIEGSSGGGHEHASGARLPADKLEVFRENLFKEIKKLDN
ncbi:MAG: DHH family phosphoesterase, partial [archaeon]|nr:DHH family phosphoesterase [archaeon]